MKVLLVNGSPREKGCTYTALQEVADELKKEEIETQIFQIGPKPLAVCLDCGACGKTGLCVFADSVNSFLKIIGDVDGFVFGIPVHYASSGEMLVSFIERAFRAERYSGTQNFYSKPAAAVISARTPGNTAAYELLNQYFEEEGMPVILSKSMNMIQGYTPKEVRKDEEGIKTMHLLGHNMSWFLKCKEAVIKAGLSFPKQEDNISFNIMLGTPFAGVKKQI